MARMADLIQRAATDTGLPPELLHSLWMQESGGRDTVPTQALAPADSVYGPWQVRGQTARDLGYKGPLSDLADPAVNTHVATTKLAQDYKKYGNIPDTVAAYYHGSAKKDAKGKYVGRPSGQGPTTQEYVDSVMSRAGAPMDPAAPAATNAYDEQASQDAQKAVEDSHAKLSEWLAQQPQIDIQKLAQPALQEAQNAPEPPPMPGPWAQFAAALGSPNHAPAILSKHLQDIVDARVQKHHDLLHIQEGLVNKQLEQAIKGQDEAKAAQLAKQSAVLNEQLHGIYHKQLTQDQINAEQRKAVQKRVDEGQPMTEADKQLEDLRHTHRAAEITQEGQNKLDEISGKAEKPMSMIEFAKLENTLHERILTAKTKAMTPTAAGGFAGFMGQKVPGKFEMSPELLRGSKNDYLSAISGGNPKVQERAARGLAQLITDYDQPSIDQVIAEDRASATPTITGTPRQQKAQALYALLARQGLTDLQISHGIIAAGFTDKDLSPPPATPTTTAAAGTKSLKKKG